MLQAKTKEQRNAVIRLLQESEGHVCVIDNSEDGMYIDDWISFSTMEKIVDYLHSVNKPKKISLDMSIVAPQMLEPVEIWLAYKKEKNQTYKPTGFKTFYKKLCELSGNNPQVAMAIIEQSMQNNYAGIFPLRNNNNNNNYGRETITDKIRRTVEEANAFSQQLTDRIGNQADVCDGDNDEVW